MPQISSANIYYANGLLLSSSDKKYIAANSSSTATAILQARTASAIFKFTTNGLLQSLNGSTFYRVNPLIWVAKISTESGTKAVASVSYNPLGKEFSYDRTDKGRIKVTHNFGHTNYTISAHGFGANSGTAATGGNRCVYLITKAATYFEVVMNLDHVNYDGICEILLYDLKSY